MRSVAALLWVVLLASRFAGAIPGTASNQDAPLTLDQYQQELSRLADEIEAADNISKADARALSGSLPLSMRVTADGKSYEISLYFLHDALAKAEAGDKQWPQAREQAQAILRALLREAAAPERDHAEAHVRANAILSAREYRAVHGPTWWDTIKARVSDWIGRLLLRILGRIGRSSMTAYFIYGFAVLILLIFAAWIWRMLGQSKQEAPLAFRSAAVSAKHWSEWLSQARVAADQHDWREAVHLVYWAGISFLEATGQWRPDRARTPREYLKLVPATKPESGILKSMTREFERAWYGHQLAAESEFGGMLQQFEALRAMQANAGNDSDAIATTITAAEQS